MNHNCDQCDGNMTVDMAIHVLVMGNRYGVQRNVKRNGLEKYSK
jgi:hypothetical protein